MPLNTDEVIVSMMAVITSPDAEPMTDQERSNFLDTMTAILIERKERNMQHNNEIDPLEALAGIKQNDDEAVERVDMLKRPIQSVGQQIMANKEAVITECADKRFGAGNWSRDQITGHIFINGFEMYSHQGIRFIKIMPVKWKNEKTADNSVKITAVQRWEYISDE